jgi:hypothetical protein
MVGHNAVSGRHGHRRRGALPIAGLAGLAAFGLLDHFPVCAVGTALALVGIAATLADQLSVATPGASVSPRANARASSLPAPSVWSATQSSPR